MLQMRLRYISPTFWPLPTTIESMSKRVEGIPMKILLVGSRAKCKTLLKHLGQDERRVLPTGGHVERLAEV